MHTFKGVNTQVTLNAVMKKAAVFHYAEWKNSEEGGAGERRAGKAERLASSWLCLKGRV